MVILINHYNYHRHAALLAHMHSDRKRVFVDLLKWPVLHNDYEERDEFDNSDAVYLVVSCSQTRIHLGSIRLLRTDKRHILGDLFPHLCEAAPPRGTDVREITRLCLAPGIGKGRRLATRNLLARSLVEYALLTGIRSYTGVAQLAWLTQILSAGWDVRPLGLAQRVGSDVLGALEIRIASDTLQRLVPSWQTESAEMRTVEFDLPLAA